jgi:hypothetical protein
MGFSALIVHFLMCPEIVGQRIPLFDCGYDV